MRIDLPQCDLKTCRCCFDGNCTDKTRYEKCDYAFLNNFLLEKIKKDLKYYLDTNEESGVVYIPKFVIEKIVYDR